MMESELQLSFNPKELGRHMGRERYERGYVKKVGKRRKVWEGHYHVYVKLPDGKEIRRHRTKNLGVCSELSKWRAEDALKKLIDAERAQTLTPAANPTLAEIWGRYKTLKEASWSSATRRAVES